MSADLSKEAKKRPRRTSHYRGHGNARMTCRRFDISPTTNHVVI